MGRTTQKRQPWAMTMRHSKWARQGTTKHGNDDANVTTKIKNKKINMHMDAHFEGEESEPARATARVESNLLEKKYFKKQYKTKNEKTTQCNCLRVSHNFN
jgi:hypothetical protein